MTRRPVTPAGWILTVELPVPVGRGLHVKVRIHPHKRSHSLDLQLVPIDATNEHVPLSHYGLVSRSLSEVTQNAMGGALSVASGALWSFLLCLFDVAFFWQRVRLPHRVRRLSCLVI